MIVVPGWIVATLVAVAVGANIGNPIGAHIVRKANNDCRQQANGRQWEVKSYVDKKKGVQFLQCHIKQTPAK